MDDASLRAASYGVRNRIRRLNNNQDVFYNCDDRRFYKMNIPDTLLNKTENIVIPVCMLDDFITAKYSINNNIPYVHKIFDSTSSVNMFKTTPRMLDSLFNKYLTKFCFSNEPDVYYFLLAGSIFDINLKPLISIEGEYIMDSTLSTMIIQKNIIKVDASILKSDSVLAKRMKKLLFDKERMLKYYEAGFLDILDNPSIPCEIQIVENIPNFITPIVFNANAETFLKDNCENILQLIE